MFHLFFVLFGPVSQPFFFADFLLVRFILLPVRRRINIAALPFFFLWGQGRAGQGGGHGTARHAGERMNNNNNNNDDDDDDTI